MDLVILYSLIYSLINNNNKMNYININNQHPGARGDFDAASEASSMEIENEVGNNVNTRAHLIPKPKAFSGRRNELPAFLVKSTDILSKI